MRLWKLAEKMAVTSGGVRKLVKALEDIWKVMDGGGSVSSGWRYF